MRYGTGFYPGHFFVEQPPDRPQRRRRILPERPADQPMNICLNRLHHDLRTHANAHASFSTSRGKPRQILRRHRPTPPQVVAVFYFDKLASHRRQASLSFRKTATPRPTSRTASGPCISPISERRR